MVGVFTNQLMYFEHRSPGAAAGAPPGAAAGAPPGAGAPPAAGAPIYVYVFYVVGHTF